MADMPKQGDQHRSGQHQGGQHGAASGQKPHDEKRPDQGGQHGAASGQKPHDEKRPDQGGQHQGGGSRARTRPVAEQSRVEETLVGQKRCSRRRIWCPTRRRLLPLGGPPSHR